LKLTKNGKSRGQPGRPDFTTTRPINHRHSQGSAPSVEKKIWKPNLQGKVESAESAPRRQNKSPFFGGNWGDLDGGRAYLGSFSMCFEGDD